jgi:hypothetical protein
VRRDYAPDMNCDASAHKSAATSFAGVLEQLARRDVATVEQKPAPRSLLPVTELKTGAYGATADGMELSYEKALRMLRRKQTESGDDPGTAKQILPVESALERAVDEGPVEAQRKPQARIGVAAAGREASRISRRSSSKSSLTSSSKMTVSKRETQTKRLPTIKNLDLQSNQRRASVSVRLTDGEITQLRTRAEECGISVSAYMRLCVLEADILRAQVKQALAKMRSVSEKSEPVRLPALAVSENAGPAKGGGWFRLLSQSAALFLSPLLPFLRSV